MPPAEERPEPAHDSGARFASTHWSVVLAAARSASPEAQTALEKLCRAYWYPLYAYLRRKGHSPHQAEDLTQEFFCNRVISRRIFQGLEPGVGRFRSWLLTCLQHMVVNEHEREQAQKRGGGAEHLSLDFKDAEGRFVAEPSHLLTPEKIYDRTWAMTLLGRALDLVAEKYKADGDESFFMQLQQYLPGQHSNRPYAEVAATVGKSEAAIKMAVSRLRQEYGRILRQEISRTVNSPTEVDEELRYLMEVLSGF
jgi:RNA polymerase sigma-70 factor (ECF subfamily)